MNPLALFALLTVAGVPLILITLFVIGFGRVLFDFITSF